MFTRTSLLLGFASVLTLSPADAQRRTPRHHRPSPPASVRPGSVAVVPPTVATTEAIPQARPNLDLGEVIPVPVSAVDGMMRRMRVFLFTAPPTSGAFGIGALGRGRRIWALLPSCRTTNPDDDREPCPVDRVTVEAVMRGNVNAGTPTFLGGQADGRRVQSFVVEDSAPRVRVRVLGPANRVRYEAVVEADRLADLPPPEGAATPAGFDFDLTRYPAR
ncbi:MAG: hypothetical protein JWM10_2229 [Myxococcaceae bacterium]|nr:hypothetical protein [Myxococcaceae bacterium]